MSQPNNRKVAFDVVMSTSEPMTTITSRASSFHKYRVIWESDTSFLLDSSDIGTYRFTRNQDGSWTESDPEKVRSPDGKWIAAAYFADDDDRTLYLTFRLPDVTNETSVQRVQTAYTINDFDEKEVFPREGKLVARVSATSIRWVGNDRLVVRFKDGTISFVLSNESKWALE